MHFCREKWISSTANENWWRKFVIRTRPKLRLPRNRHRCSVSTQLIISAGVWLNVSKILWIRMRVWNWWTTSKTTNSLFSARRSTSITFPSIRWSTRLKSPSEKCKNISNMFLNSPRRIQKALPIVARMVMCLSAGSRPMLPISCIACSRPLRAGPTSCLSPSLPKTPLLKTLPFPRTTRRTANEWQVCLKAGSRNYICWARRSFLSSNDISCFNNAKLVYRVVGEISF